MFYIWNSVIDEILIYYPSSLSHSFIEAKGNWVNKLIFKLFNLNYSQIYLKRSFSLCYFVMYFVYLRGKKILNTKSHKVLIAIGIPKGSQSL